jgi:hypothetical protein
VVLEVRMKLTDIENLINPFIPQSHLLCAEGILRYKVDFQSMQTDEEPLSDVDLDEY